MSTVDGKTIRLAAAMADPSRRGAAARDLAAHAGAVALLMFVEDPSVEALVPAPGFQQTLPGAAGWAELLRRARAPGIHHGTVGYPSSAPLLPATAISDHGLTLVVLGEHCDPAAVEDVRALAPLLAATLRAEHDARTADGERRVARDEASQSGNLARALDAARAEVERNVVALERQARDLAEARTRAEHATQAKDDFLAMVGHELRGPLSPIVTALHLLRLENRSSREVDIIQRQVETLTRLVDDLLDVSRITLGKVDIRKQDVELGAIAARAIEMASPFLDKKGQVLSVQIPPRGLIVRADPSRLAQVFANLLTNAAKYSDAGSSIVFAAEPHEAAVRVRVKDHGIGLSREIQERIFDLFVQHRPSLDRSQGGLGLGLAIVRSLVALHGGTVTVHSEGEGHGSEFIVELPRSTYAVSALRA